MSDFIQIYRDAETGSLGIRHVDENGDLVEDEAQVRLSLGDLQYAGQPDEMPIQAVFRRVHYTAEDGSKMRCYGLLTIPEDDSEDDGHSSDAEDLRIGGGGGGGAQRYRVKLVGGSWLGCHQMNGTTEGGGSSTQLLYATVSSAGNGYSVGNILTPTGVSGSAAAGTYSTQLSVMVLSITGGGATGPIGTVSVICPGTYSAFPATPTPMSGGTGSAARLTLNFTAAMTFVAKVPQLRWNLGECIEGLGNTYEYFFRALNADKLRKDTAVGYPIQQELVVPLWHVGTTVDSSDGQWSEIFADTPQGGVGGDPVGGDVVDPYGNAITLMDQNRDARRWLQIA